MKFKPKQPARTWNVSGLKAWAVLWAQMGMLGLLATMSNFLSNRYEVAVQDLVVPVIVDLAAAALVAAVFYRTWRRDRIGGVVAGGLVALVLTSSYDDRFASILPTMQALLPLPSFGGVEGAFCSAVFIALMFVMAYWVGRLLSKLTQRWHWNERETTAALFVGIATTFAFLALPLVRDVVVEWPQFFYKPPKLAAAPRSAQQAAKPDIYYIVMDRYASEDVLKQQFNYDNSDFINYLKQNQYYVNPSAHNNYPFTTMSIASTMDANYLNDAITKFSRSSQQTVVPFNESIRNSAVAQGLKALGYKYHLIGNWYETSNVSQVADTTYQQTGRLTVLGMNFTLNNFSKIILTKSAFWRLIQPGLTLGKFTVFSYTNLGDVDMTNYALQSLRDEVNKPAGGRFIFAHILVPHDPYYFNADGSLSSNTGTDNIGEPVKQKYLGQLQYVSSQMKDILSNINRASNGQAVVVLQSDEGPYPNQLNDEDFDEESVNDELKGGDMRNWSDLDLEMKFGNLAAYRIPKANLDTDPMATEAADSVNVFRLVFNTYFGTTMPYLPDCYYAYPNGKDQPMVFSDITKRLTDAPEDSRCLANGTVKE